MRTRNGRNDSKQKFNKHCEYPWEILLADASQCKESKKGLSRWMIEMITYQTPSTP